MKVNRIPTHYGVAYESVCSLARGHVIRVGELHQYFISEYGIYCAVISVFYLSAMTWSMIKSRVGSHYWLVK